MPPRAARNFDGAELRAIRSPDLGAIPPLSKLQAGTGVSFRLFESAPGGLVAPATSPPFQSKPSAVGVTGMIRDGV